MLGATFLSVAKASAAEPGCYERWLVDTSGIAVGKVECSVYQVWFPGWQQSDGNGCWMLDLDPSGVANTSNPPKQTDCASITVNNTAPFGVVDNTQTAQERKDAQLASTASQATVISGCTSSTGGKTTGCATEGYITSIINILSASVGIIVVIMLIVGGIQYSSAGGDPSRIAAAKKRIYSALLALITFLFLFALLQWLVPGGVL